MGARKKPSEERGPKLIIAIRQPHSTTTIGVRQPRLVADFSAALSDDMTNFQCAKRIEAARTEAERRHSTAQSITNIADPSYLPSAWLGPKRVICGGFRAGTPCPRRSAAIPGCG